MDDLISRQAVIERLTDIRICLDDESQQFMDLLIREINDLPSAEPEIIRCKDCKNSEHWYRDKLRCFLWHKTGIDVFEDGYCNYAERRTYG